MLQRMPLAKRTLPASNARSDCDVRMVTVRQQSAYRQTAFRPGTEFSTIRIVISINMHSYIGSRATIANRAGSRCGKCNRAIHDRGWLCRAGIGVVSRRTLQADETRQSSVAFGQRGVASRWSGWTPDRVASRQPTKGISHAKEECAARARRYLRIVSAIYRVTSGRTDRGRQQPETVEEVVVTGIRSSLQHSLDMKREASGVVDVITAEDIGKFPDSNVAASLQRVPGVSIQRSGTRGEPTGITVRGFGGDFNETLYDGRRISTATGGRSVDFSTVGADFVGALTVMKTPDVTLSSSSIGATINIAVPEALRPPRHALQCQRRGQRAGRGEFRAAHGRRAVQRHLRRRHDRHPGRCHLHASVTPTRTACSSPAGKAASSVLAS